MPPYNPNGVWTSKNNPNLPREARSRVTPSTDKEDATKAVPAEIPPEQSEGSPKASRKEPARFRQGPGFLKKYGLWVFIGGIIIVIIGAVAVMEILKPPAPVPATIAIGNPSNVQVGIPFTLSIATTNHAPTPLTGAVLSVELPQGVEFVGNGPSTQVKEYPQGTIAPGQVVTQTSSLIVTGNPDTLYAIATKLLYSTPQTPKATFESDQSMSFSAGGSPVTLSYTAPTNVVSGQNFPVTVSYANNGADPIPSARIVLQYPPAYTFVTSSIAEATDTVPSSSLGTWELGTLAPGQGGSFTVTGNIVGPSRAQYQIGGTISTRLAGRTYPMNAQPVNLALVPAPLALSISVNGNPRYTTFAGDQLSYTLTYTNNSEATLSDVKIAATLTGRMFDFTSLQTQGAFDSRNDTVTWYAANTPALASLAPGQSGSVTFSVNVKNTFPITQLGDKNYALAIRGTIESPTVIPGAPGSNTISVATITNKVGGQMELTSVGYWKSGPYPPKVNQPTSYRIDWAIKNYSTDASSVTVSAYLQSGTSFIGAASSTGTTSTPSYDPGTGLVTWTIPYIPAGTGIIDPSVKASFIVSNTPAVNQAGSDVTLLGPTTLTASDTWTGGSFNLQANSVTTALPNDPAVAGSGTNGAVVQ